MNSGKPRVNSDPLRAVLKEALQATGCPSVKLHGLRHTYASLLIEQGAGPKYIQKQMGHASIQMTVDIYGHLVPEANQEVMQRLDEQVFGTGQKGRF